MELEAKQQPASERCGSTTPVPWLCSVYLLYYTWRRGTPRCTIPGEEELTGACTPATDGPVPATAHHPTVQCVLYLAKRNSPVRALQPQMDLSLPPLTTMPSDTTKRLTSSLCPRSICTDDNNLNSRPSKGKPISGMSMKSINKQG